MAAQMTYYQATPGSGQPASAVPGASGANQASGLGYITQDQLGTDQWGAGDSFQGAARQGSQAAIKNGMSTANPADYGNQDQMRSYLTNYLSQLPQQTQDANSQLDSSSQRGLSNALSQNANSHAGSGTIGSRQNQAAQSGITANAGQNYMNGLIANRANELAKANQAGSGLSSIMNNNGAERQFQFQQGQGLTSNINDLTSLDQQRVMNNWNNQNQKDQNTTNAWSGLASSALSNGANMFKGAGSMVAGG